MTDEMESAPARPSAGTFVTTHWSMVLAAGDNNSPDSHAALSRLCANYWYPLYAYVRRQGHGPHEAQDLTQEFFARMLDKHYLRAADPHKGRFRSFLLAALEHFLAKEWRDARRLKRGGGMMPISLDLQDAEGRYEIEPADQTTPELIYERRWALTLLETSLRRLREESLAAGREKQFAALHIFLSGQRPGETYAEIGNRLGLSEDAVKKSVQRLRERYGQLVRAEIANTVARPEDVDEELRHLMAILAGTPAR